MQIKALGMPHLEATTLEIINKTREPLFLAESEMGPSPDQLAEANRIFGVLSDVMDTFSRRDATFSIKGEPIVIMDVEVSKDLKQARVYWTLPFSVTRYDQHVVEQVKERMQQLLEKKGGKLQRLVHAQLRSYYPPKLRFVPSPDDLFGESIKKLAKKSAPGRTFE
jgi:ribosome-binding factor A